MELAHDRSLGTQHRATSRQLMEVAALAVALLALAVATVVGAFEIRTGRRLQQLESARRHDELTPDLGLEWHRLPGSEPTLLITNRGPRDLDRLEWSFDVDYSRHPLSGLGPGATTSGAIDVGLMLGATAQLQATTQQPASGGPMSGRVSVVLSCFAGDEQWRLHRSVEVQHGDGTWR